MIIKFAKTFDRGFEKLERNVQKNILETIKFFRENPEHPSLRNHELH
jgi:mRNA-degrading endonuclease RelE of RelBE toxin-antitoxin system